MQPRYDILKEVAKGANHVGIFKCIDKQTKDIVYMKKFPKQDIDENFFYNEVAINKMVDGQCVIKVLDSYELNDSYAMIMEAGDKDLLDHISDNGPIPETECMEQFHGIMQTIVYMHEKNILHNDIKLENIVIRNGKYMLIDFGLSEVLDENANSNKQAGSNFYIAPEISQRKPHGTASDIYSLGVTLYTALAGNYPYDFDNSFTYTIAQMSGDVNFNNLEELQVSERVISLLKMMLHPKPEQRPSAKECLQLGWNNN